MDRSEESKEGNVECFRSGLHPSGGEMALEITDGKQSSEVRDYLYILIEGEFDSSRPVDSFIGNLPAAHGGRFAVIREQRTLNENRYTNCKF